MLQDHERSHSIKIDSEADSRIWAVRLFQRSVLKQNKFKAITRALGDVHSLKCLDLGGDNGVISYLLRKQGGDWSSADLSDETVHAIRRLVEKNVSGTDGKTLPYADNEFDRVVIVDILEHVEDDQRFINEVYRVAKNGGEIIINTPRHHRGILKRIRLRLGQTDEAHGHIRSGYSIKQIDQLLDTRFKIVSFETYSKFFSELMDTVLRSLFEFLKGKEKKVKGTILTQQDTRKFSRVYRIYSLVYPLVWLFSSLDQLLWKKKGYMLLVKARVKK